ncbi:MAG: transcription termination factor NusA [Gammaproteobacteria bacterium]|nr:transcription termination factor NusA [Gammaproteobacteria bacterium]MXW10934.1 transcription termination factor NusA [Gammaproteobacteria bacterium]MYC52255.1 transcription termination factor NusA [Gammaproteobacteria bacterium]
MIANSGQIIAAFRDMAATKNLSVDELNELIQDGIMAGLARIHGPNVRAEIDVDDMSGAIDIVVLKRVVDQVEDGSAEISLEEARWDDEAFEVGDLMEIPMDFTEFGRNAVMATKQRIVQRIRENERDRIREEFADRVGELLSGDVQQIERGKVVVMLNLAKDADAIIPWKEQNPRERFRQGDPIRAVLKKIEESPKGPRLILSRADPVFVESLFRLEVPEIYQGIVDIREKAREVGGRTKIAVSSRDESIDPVGACVGLKGSRVQAVVSELGGERIDIVPWHPDPEVFARRALAPARVAKVISNYDNQVITAIVDEDQLSLAIGRNGQNVRLASQLIGWQIDLYGSREWLERGADTAIFPDAEENYETSDFPLSELELPADALQALGGAGYTTFLQIINLARGEFLAIPGLSTDAVDQIVGLIDELTVIEGEEDAQPEALADGEHTDG